MDVGAEMPRGPSPQRRRKYLLRPLPASEASTSERAFFRPRFDMIRELAERRAAERGESADSHGDWYEAEAEVERRLALTRPR